MFTFLTAVHPTEKTTEQIVGEMPEELKIVKKPEKKDEPPIHRQAAKVKSAAPELPKRQKSPLKDDAQQKSGISRKSESPKPVDSKKMKPKKLVRIVLRKPNGEESIEDVAVDLNATPKDIDKAIKNALKKKLLQIKNPKIKIITQVIDSKPGEEESIEEFETYPETARKNLDEVLKKAVLTKITKKKDPSGKIIMNIFKRKPDGSEIVEEYVEDPKITG
ncbi:hypothetical protein BLA29_010835, partial [Euroglyphus maynei]